VCRLERACDLSCERQRFINRDGALFNALGKRRPLDQLQHERLHPVRFFETVNGRDVRVIQRGQEFRFPPETREPVDVACEAIRKTLTATSRFNVVSRAR
jgi:hypothetical protein